MAWTVPMTAVSGSVFTAAQFNQYVRDNLNATAPALATTVSSYFTTSGPNAIVERYATSDFQSASSTTTSTSYTDLADGAHPVVSVVTGSMAWVAIYCNMQESLTNGAWMSYVISGATTLAASDDRAIQLTTSGGERLGAMFLQTGLTPGTNVFTGKYRVSTSGTGTFSVRRLAVWPL